MVDLQEATVHWDAAQKSVILKEGLMETEGGAYGYFNDTLLLSGWSILEISAGHGGISQEDETTFFLAGYLEGYLTAGWAETGTFHAILSSEPIMWQQCNATYHLTFAFLMKLDSVAACSRYNMWANP